jgi:two-component system, sensor histidine kinase and response regulator
MLRILIVDDNQTNRQLLIDMLLPLGYEMQQAENGQQALDMVEESSPSVVLMDISMPVMDGITATRHIRKMPGHEKLPVIAVTAYARDVYEDEAMDAGCNAYLTKPLDIDLLYSLVEEYAGSGE